MSSLGVGAILHRLAGGSKNDKEVLYGRPLKSVTLTDDKESMIFAFQDGRDFLIRDDGQSCREKRYLTCDDDLSSLPGQTIQSVEVRYVTEDDADGEPHEMCFVRFTTNQETFTLTAHNEHNGYYGGFGLTIDRVSENI